MKNIALIGYSLHHGGAEKVMANLSLILQKNDFQLHTIIVNDGIEYSYGGKLLNLGLLPNTSSFDRLNKFWKLFKFLITNKIDYIIDFRARINNWEEIVIANFLYFFTKPIFTIHSYKIENYLPQNRILFKFWTLRNPIIISVSEAISNQIKQKYNYKNIFTINNPIDIDSILNKASENIKINEKFILFVGRLSEEKQIPELIVSYSNSLLPKQNIKLLIIGEGVEEFKIKSTINDLAQQENVILLGKKTDPYPYMKQAKFLVLCSKFEGFPTVLIESLACKTPVISFDCNSGPSEIISHKTNGLLVENQNFEALTNAFNLMIEDENLLQLCQSNTILKLENLSYSKIFLQWIAILK